MRLGLALLAPVVWVTSPALADDQVSLQDRFLVALALMEGGRPNEAVTVLRDLYDRAPTPRVRLELARALFLAGDLAASKQLFVEAYNAAPPADVRANILSFINVIDRRRGKLSLSASVARYANPLQQPGTYSLNFAGIDLTFEPDGTYRDLWGVTGEAQYQKDFSSGLSLSLAASYRELPGSLADRFLADASIGKALNGGKYEVRAGVTRFDQPNQSFTLPFAQVTYNHSLSNKAMLQPALRLGYYVADAGSQVSGWQIEAVVPLVYAPEPSKTVMVGPTIVRHSVGFAEQSYTSLGIRAAAVLKWEKVNLEVSAQARSTRFDDVDPFWGERRKDKGAAGSIALSSDRFRLGPFIPVIGLTCDFTRSTIRYYQQQGCDALVEIRKVF